MPKASHVNESSLREASPTPPMTGSKERYTGIGRYCFRNTAVSAADTTGSDACHSDVDKFRQSNDYTDFRQNKERKK